MLPLLRQEHQGRSASYRVKRNKISVQELRGLSRTHIFGAGLRNMGRLSPNSVIPILLPSSGRLADLTHAACDMVENPWEGENG